VINVQNESEYLMKRLRLRISSRVFKKIFVSGAKACIFIFVEKMIFSRAFVSNWLAPDLKKPTHRTSAYMLTTS